MTVSEMVLKILLKLSSSGAVPVESASDAINESVRYLALRLADRNSDLSRANISRTITKRAVVLPEDFNGFSGKPYIDDLPLELVSPSYIVPDPGTPLFYEVVASTLYLYPAPAAAVALTAKYWVLPPTLSGSDDLPFNGLFDSLLSNMALGVCTSGTAVITDQSFISMVEQGLDMVLFPRRPALRSVRPYNGF